MRKVIIETPFAGDIEKNLEYARAAMHDCLMRGEAPFASHMLYTQEGVLRDEIPIERERGIEAGFAWKKIADETIVYIDRGISGGMKKGIEASLKIGQPIITRSMDAWRGEDSEQNEKEVFDMIKDFYIAEGNSRKIPSLA